MELVIEITDGESTTSDDIDIYFYWYRQMLIMMKLISERGFVCTLDEEPGGDPITIDPCGDPVTGVNPFTGIHQELNLDLLVTYTFEVTAFIVIGEDHGYLI